VSLEGCHDLAPSFDSCGYFTRDGATFVRVGEVLLGRDSHPLPPGPKVLLAKDAFALLAGPVREALQPALRQAAAVLGAPEERDVVVEGFTALYWAMRYIQSREAWNVDGPMIERYRPPLGPASRTGSSSRRPSPMARSPSRLRSEARFGPVSALFWAKIRC
jgi:amidase